VAAKVPRKIAAKVKKIHRNVDWTKAKSEAYRTAPHEYITIWSNPKKWKKLADIIREHGEYHQWRGQRFKYLQVGKNLYWWLGSVINRTYKSALANEGYPSKAEQKRIFKRFWGGSDE